MGGANTPSPQFEALLKLGLSEKEALEVLETDKEIDRGAKLFELDPELEKGAKKARRAERKPNSTPHKAREPDQDKRHIMELLQKAVEQDVTILNAEREFLFTYNEKKYKVTLSCPRS